MLLCVFSEVLPSSKINFDLSDCDEILRVEGFGINTLPKTNFFLLNLRFQPIPDELIRL